MSLIESALQKLRRAGEEQGAAVTKPASAHSKPISTPLVAPARDLPHKKISIDNASLRAAGYLPELGLERRFADHYRQIKRPLIDRALSGAEARLILVTSALPGDGKTFTSINLAFSMARERDISVLLVDADAPRAQVSSVLGVRHEAGLLNTLLDETLDIESLIIETDVRGLEILPAGKLVENAPELIASARMDQIITRLNARSARQIIVIDSAPLLVSSEARALLRVPGLVLLVVRANVTPRQAALEAIGYVDKKKLQGLVLNQVSPNSIAGYYSYTGYGESGDSSGSDQ